MKLDLVYCARCGCAHEPGKHKPHGSKSAAAPPVAPKVQMAIDTGVGIVPGMAMPALMVFKPTAVNSGAATIASAESNYRAVPLKNPDGSPLTLTEAHVGRAFELNLQTGVAKPIAKESRKKLPPFNPDCPSCQQRRKQNQAAQKRFRKKNAAPK